MGEIYLIRHAQASFGAAQYDDLSKLGYQQAEGLARWLKESNLTFAKVLSGNLNRHQQTLQVLQQSLSLPPAQIHTDLNEFDYLDVIAKSVGKDSLTQQGLNLLFSNESEPEVAFGKLFHSAMLRWVSGEHDDDYAESWPDFSSRAMKCLMEVVRAAEHGELILVVTSGGIITTLCRQILGMSGPNALQLNYALVNASITHLTFLGERLRLNAFNNYSHLQNTPSGDCVSRR